MNCELLKTLLFTTPDQHVRFPGAHPSIYGWGCSVRLQDTDFSSTRGRRGINNKWGRGRDITKMATPPCQYPLEANTWALPLGWEMWIGLGWPTILVCPEPSWFSKEFPASWEITQNAYKQGQLVTPAYFCCFSWAICLKTFNGTWENGKKERTKGSWSTTWDPTQQRVIYWVPNWWQELR